MSAEERSEKMIDIGGFQLCIRCVGQGTPTVIFEAGLGGGLADWITTQDRVAAFTCACAYDRAGVGNSDRSTEPRTSQQMVTELHMLLRNAHIEGPYVLVGHSLGGLNVQLFAMRYPDQVAGLVLIDPSFADMLERFDAILPDEWKPLWDSQFESDAEGMTKQDFVTSCTQVSAAGLLPDIPLVVLSAGQPVQLPPEFSAFPAAESVRVTQTGHAALVNATTRGQQRIVPEASHASLAFQTDLIVNTIRQVVESAR
jgi:pimeloyl-ACP methyl ester carboxylesterase